jgi:hypothetical protein
MCQLTYSTGQSAPQLLNDEGLVPIIASYSPWVTSVWPM